MALKYTTLAKLNEYLWTSGQDTLITSIWEGAEALFDTLIGTTLEVSSRTDIFNVGYSDCTLHEWRIFYLNAQNIIDITTINGVDIWTLDTDYVIENQKLELRYGVSIPSTFPYRYKVVYTAGYATIPNDVILAINTITGAMYNTKNAQGISSFKQDLLSVNYESDTILDTLWDSEAKGMLEAIINKYKVHSVLI